MRSRQSLRRGNCALLLLCIAWLTGNAAAAVEKPSKSSISIAGPAFSGTTRLAIAYQQLTRDRQAHGPVRMEAFAPPPDAQPPSHSFNGRLTLGTERPGGGFQVLVDQYGDADANGGAARHLPPFDFDFVQAGNAVVPVKRGAIPSIHPAWEFILEPGRIWDESRDHGMSRVALPFTLEERNANCMHSGMMTFLFDGRRVSDVAFEIASETCLYFKFNTWGQFAATYTPASATDSATATAYVREVSHRLPVKPIEELARDFAGSDPAQFGSADEIPAADMTLYGVVANGVNYVSQCDTRFGAYPDCAVLDVPSYSLAKSMVAGITTMRLQRLHPGMISERIGAYVPACAAAGTWNDVTFGNVLDMGSGHFLRAADQADEDAPDMNAFFLADDHATRIAFACTHYPRAAAPGTQWVYHTADTYLLGTALNAYVRRMDGAGADFYRDVLARDIWTTLDLNPAVFVTRRTYDAAAQPFTGYGLTLKRDDVARIADFLNVDHGAAKGTQLLDPPMLRQALQQDPASPGLRASSDEFRYHDGFWAWNAQTKLGCKKPTWVPYMSGYGGITVALFPNGMTYYYFSDSGIWRWAKAAAEANRIKPYCRV